MTPTPLEALIGQINKVAETHFFLRPVLKKSLKETIISPEGQAEVGPYANYYDYWTGTLSDKFFDMATFMRLGSVLEFNLRNYYTLKKGYSSLLSLTTDPLLCDHSGRFDTGLFQRIVQAPTKTKGIGKVFDSIGVDLTDTGKFPDFIKLRELMLHRHLYAHKSGLVDDEYMKKLKDNFNIDISADIASKGYPAQDVYYFEPLSKLNDFIEDSRKFFNSLPY
ncbi:hypothetical protein COW36_21160 [bacterium (Candidatus Blackallbacteria) CG17_big_fil_post_rev_8_21_14_2_50_48_46]|uniref:RiboL-PSP-HEPN domain-containing protein n=1 Tax=bacterium (Candidatus Blackallbacteria) CG17_big_fil_post_rev_8_21_14_2_50_48_46 TaxID=2014261 RepID=A0A2M7FYU8_9BACT|nr:MAG: hypothetical protein COW64_14470 [bacterium (Candidatus Blackallbacteria) CG18_big_fil_WC_8_21_14_2_50_49_26]PIW14550.1 MAG: hypothetical protein COW36_21160 [bacterium (Candidatus Blackallbacteria) CG17_big_fil_post_rev_8_21_14_2_50_48_46]PIW47235.1 MAG: hypothetical protein COW20_13605 [bacterium (Candidatus Blackallbacteria) CG13_big_fil_rev_8_21_14_2_50_49_14]